MPDRSLNAHVHVRTLFHAGDLAVCDCQDEDAALAVDEHGQLMVGCDRTRFASEIASSSLMQSTLLNRL